MSINKVSRKKSTVRKAAMTKYFPELEELEPIFIELDQSKDWQKRMASISHLVTIIEASPEKVAQSKYLPKVFDSFMALAHDPNNKVQSLALNIFSTKILEIFRTNINESCLTPTLSAMFN
jgi:hypothetical protein